MVDYIYDNAITGDLSSVMSSTTQEPDVSTRTNTITNTANENTKRTFFMTYFAYELVDGMGSSDKHKV